MDLDQEQSVLSGFEKSLSETKPSVTAQPCRRRFEYGASEISEVVPVTPAIKPVAVVKPTLTGRLLPQLKTLSVDDKVVATYRLNDEWHSDDWDRVNAFSLTRMRWDQFTKMMDEVDVIFGKLSQEITELDEATRSTLGRKALQQWAKEKLST